MKTPISPLPRPLLSLPVGMSTSGNVPTCGVVSVSWMKRYFTPSSVSPGP